MDKSKFTLAAVLIALLAAPLAILAHLYRRPLPKVNGTLRLGANRHSPLRAPV